jgi:glycosyltransferase involved in cell wall biosynthesis
VRSQRLPLNLNDLTVLILTSNEEANIGRTLEALRWVARVVIVDSQSTDRTLEITRTFSNVQIYQRQFDAFAEQCNFGLTRMTTEWVLSLDADYVLTPELQEELKKLRPPQDVRGYSIAFDYCVFGRPLRNSILPPRTVLYRRTGARYRNEGHGHRVAIDGKVERLRGHIWHDDRKPLSRWIQSQDRYTEIEAAYLLKTPEDKLNRPDKIRKWIFVAPLIMPIYLLLARHLILDGWIGWYYVFQRAIVETLLSLRLLEQKLGDGE